MSKDKALHKAFSIACVGASAGGLEALTQLFNALPKRINMAFVLVQHLEPDHESMLAEILSRGTILSIAQAKNNTKIKAGHIYVIPPNSNLSVSHGMLKITLRINLRTANICR